MKTPPQFQTPQFKAIQAEWYARAAEGPDGIDDIERPPPCRPNGDPGRHRAYYGRDYIRSDNPAGRNLPLDDLLAAEAAETSPVLKRDETPLWASPVAGFEEALHHFQFKSRTDRAIARHLSNGEGYRAIAKNLRCSQKRIARVVREVRAWLANRR